VNRTVMIMAGGTGGHVFPALAIAEMLRASREIVWLGTQAGIEARLVPAAGYPVEWIEVEGLRGKGLGRWLTAPLRLLRAVAQARKALARRRPGVVLGLGGFASAPGGIAAWLAGTPLVVHEQNAVAGLTNRWLARLASLIAEGFPGSFPAAQHAIYVGNPVRPDIASLPAPRQRFESRNGPMRLFVFGGSQGALALNRLVPAAVALLPESRRPWVLHQTGTKDREATEAAYRAAGVQADVRPFIDDMAAAYANADLVISRSGASTVSELAAAGVGSILVPYPAAVDDHQTRNAEWLGRVSAAQVVAEAGLTAPELANRLATLFGNGRARLLAMAEAARSLAVTDAARRVADLCLQAEGGRA
jgi:UDP-N-acetylglucosamine--N-acetylmuramyl-(pentapeptide) pyrophosphoryl-undecaprenol N-acetylglucosamine transferase